MFNLKGILGCFDPAVSMREEKKKRLIAVEMKEEDITAKARSLRAQLDRLLERFRGDTIIEGDDAALVVEEVRVVISEEFFDVIQYSEEVVLQQAVLMTFDESKRLPIHLACDKNAPISILRRLLEADKNKTSIREADKWGDLPCAYLLCLCMLNYYILSIKI